MPYAVMGFLDPATENTVLNLWQAAADAGLAVNRNSEGLRPHVTLAAYEDLDVTKAERCLAPLVTRLDPCCLTLSHLGLFIRERPVVFLGPTVTSELLDLHSALHDLCGRLGTNPDPHYLPGQWVPHTTIALDLTLEAALQVVEMSAALHFPLIGHLVEVGAIEFRPIRPCFTLALGPCPVADPDH